jgi:hypothetical protein
VIDRKHSVFSSHWLTITREAVPSVLKRRILNTGPTYCFK